MKGDTRDHRLLKIYADSMNKRVLMALFCSAISILLLIFIVSSFAIPHNFLRRPCSMIDKKENNVEEFDDYPELQCIKEKKSSFKDHVFYFTGLQSNNLYISFFGHAERFKSESDTEMDLVIDFKAKLTPYNLEDGQEVSHTDLEHVNEHKLKIFCHSSLRDCEETSFMFYPQVRHESYRLHLELEVNETYKKIIEEFVFSIKVRNPKYTTFALVLRYLCFSLSLVFGFIYLCFYRTIQSNYRTFEHKFIVLLSLALILFNDPFYAVTILKASKFWAILSALFVVIFISSLIFFWVVMVQRIHMEGISVRTKLMNKKNIAILIGVFLVLIITTGIESVISRFDPAFHVNYEMPLVYDIFLVLLLLTTLFLIAVFAYNSYKICKKWNMIIQRYQFYFLISFYFVIALFFMMITGLYHAYDFNGVRLLMLFLLFNFYIIVLQFMWRFDRASEGSFIEAKKTRVPDEVERNKKDIGMDYFNDKIDIGYTSSKDTSKLTDNEGEPIKEDFVTGFGEEVEKKEEVKEEEEKREFEDNSDHSSLDLDTKEKEEQKEQSDNEEEKDKEEKLEYIKFNDESEEEEEQKEIEVKLTDLDIKNDDSPTKTQ